MSRATIVWVAAVRPASRNVFKASSGVSGGSCTPRPKADNGLMRRRESILCTF